MSPLLTALLTALCGVAALEVLIVVAAVRSLRRGGGEAS